MYIFSPWTGLKCVRYISPTFTQFHSGLLSSAQSNERSPLLELKVSLKEDRVAGWEDAYMCVRKSFEYPGYFLCKRSKREHMEKKLLVQRPNFPHAIVPVLQTNVFMSTTITEQYSYYNLSSWLLVHIYNKRLYIRWQHTQSSAFRMQWRTKQCGKHQVQRPVCVFCIEGDKRLMTW